MQEKNVKENAFTNFIWRFAERVGAQGVNFIVSIVLARLLDAEVYGTVAIVTVFMTILQVFVDSGMANAIIIKKDVDDTDYSTVFYFNMFICIILYAIMYVAAPYIAAFYAKPELTSITRVLGIILIISGIKNVQQAYVSRNLIFKRFFFSTLGGTIVAAVAGIILAIKGYGVWALVVQYLLNSAIDTTILYFTVKWRPKLLFSFSRLKELFSCGWKLLASTLLNTVYDNMRQLIIGKVYSSADLAYFNRGKQYPSLIIANVNSSIDSVLLPILSKEQENKERLKAMTRRAISLSSYVIWPLMVGLSVCAEPIVIILLTEKWLPVVPYIRMFCFSYAFWPIHTANLNAIKAVGRADIFLKLEIIKKGIDVIILLFTLRYGAEGIAFGVCLAAIANVFINAGPNTKLLDYTYVEQLKDVLPSILLSGVMGFIVYMIFYAGLGVVMTLILQVLCGIIVYVAGSKIFKISSFDYILSLIRRK